MERRDLAVSLLDGPDEVTLYPEISDVDDDGNPIRRADLDAPVVVRGSMQPTASIRDDTDGQAVDTSYRLLCRAFPAGAWALAEWDGRRWAVSGEPRRRHDSPGVAHATVVLTALSPAEVP
jgi:hypothetical protein